MLKVKHNTRSAVIVQRFVHSFPEVLFTGSFENAEAFVASTARDDHDYFVTNITPKPEFAVITIVRLSDGVSLDRHINWEA